jgi:hypothetical protein
MYYNLQKKQQFVFSIKIDGKSCPLLVYELSPSRFLFIGKDICGFYTATALVRSAPAPNEKKGVKTIFCQKQKYSTNYVRMGAGEYRKFINEFKQAFNIQTQIQTPG